VKLSRKRPNFEKTKPAWTCRDSNTIFTPAKYGVLAQNSIQKKIVKLSHVNAFPDNDLNLIYCNGRFRQIEDGMKEFELQSS